MDSLIRQRASIKAQITRIENFLQKPECTTADIKVRYAKIDDIIKQFDIVQTSIEQSVGEEKFQDELNARDEFETNSYKVKAKMFSLLEEAATAIGSPFQYDEANNASIGAALESIVNNQTTLNSILEKLSDTSIQRETIPNRGIMKTTLPELSIPEFSGVFDDWVRFRDLFAAIIKSRKDLAGIEKMEYLQGRLKGEALSIIKHLSPSDDNFETAWALLCERYNKTSLIVDAHLRKLFEQPPIKTESLDTLKQFYFTTNENYNALQVLKQPVLSWSKVLLYHLLKKLDKDSKLAWSRETRKIEEPTFQQFLTFLSERIAEKEKFEDCSRNVQKLAPLKSAKNRTLAVSFPSCLKCKQNHSLYQCSSFKELSVDSRNEFVRTNGICPNCLHAKHNVTECKFSNCRLCKGRHNTLLHETKSSANVLSVNAAEYVPIPKYTNTSILPTAIVMVSDSQGVLQPCRALLDSGSQSTLISESCTQRLKLPRTNAKVSISGIGQPKKGMTTRGKVVLNIAAAEGITTSAYVVPALTDDLPQVRLTESSMKFFRKLNLADPYFGQPGAIDILLGVDIVFQALIDGQITHPSQALIAKNTLFGWVVAGNTESIEPPTDISVLKVSFTDLDHLLRGFWEQESLTDGVGSNESTENPIEEHFRQTHTVRADGRFVVKLPFISIVSSLGETRDIAINRLYAMERRFRSDSNFKAQYTAFMRDYESQGHMTRITDNDKRGYYLPHHAVLKPTSTSTKLRVVFDASAKPRKGLALNECLMVGPVIQNDLFTILVRFRTFRLAVTADIAQMYRQILINDSDSFFQKIYWRGSDDEDLSVYKLNTVTYGTTPASFLATRTLKQIALNHTNDYPNACSHLLEQFYMDDYLGGEHTVEAAKNIVTDLNHLLSSAGMQLRKWSSNNQECVADIPASDREASEEQLIGGKGAIKTLGMWWQPQSDVFRFRIQLNDITLNGSKRELLSIVARIFDPLGWLSPMVIFLKILLKKVWSTGIGWDDPIPKPLLDEYNTFRDGAECISELSVSRWTQFLENSRAELHVFADSSKLAYGAVVYLRIEDFDNKIYVSLIASKTRVAPSKPELSIPRLELCAALLAAQLIDKVSLCIKHANMQLFGWTDSTAVLYWIKGYPRQRNVFVDNRLSKIVSLLPATNWNYVPTAVNPADYTTRGIAPKDLLNLSSWWYGADFLHHSTVKRWAIPPNALNVEACPAKTSINQISQLPDFYAEHLSRFSNFTRLVRTIARIKRLFRSKGKTVKGSLTANELDEARLTLIRLAQQSMFKSEINLLKSGKQIPKRGAFYGLDAYIDERCIVRINGRLTSANIPYEQAHPAILHNNHHFSRLLIESLHKRNLHAGVRQTVVLVSLAYHVIGCSRAVRRCIYRCPVCMRFKAVPYQQLMGQLPRQRVQPSMPFINTGVDYCGPVTIRAWKGRGAKTYKAYIAVFVCMATKALHLEAVTELSTEAFIATLRRFVARRGLCRSLFSDNGLNFVGANQFLRNVFNLHSTTEYQNAIADEATMLGIDWHFSPPHAPNFGGLWEAGVKTVKFHLRRVMGTSSFTFEELSTVLCQIEACANSRPLCLRFEGDTDPLTPAHFLIMRPMKAVPDQGSTVSTLNRWRYMQAIVNDFWRKWSTDYLTQLRRRPKWQKLLANIKLDDVVVLKDPNLPPCKWQLGRITCLHPGSDGLVRVVDVKTESGEYRRAISKICPLFIDE